MRFGRRSDPEFIFVAATVDLVAQAADGTTELVIVMAHPWTGADVQVASFQEKVQTYVSYALDGQMVRDYPETQGKPWRIVVSASSDPDARTQHVLDVLATKLPDYGGSLLVRRTGHGMP